MINPYKELEELRVEFEYNQELFLYWVEQLDYDTAKPYFYKAHELIKTIDVLYTRLNTPVSERETFIL